MVAQALEKYFFGGGGWTRDKTPPAHETPPWARALRGHYSRNTGKPFCFLMDLAAQRGFFLARLTVLKAFGT